LAITTYPLNGIDYDAADAAGFTATRTSGVYSSEEDFAVTAAGGLSVTVSAGVGWVNPARFEGYSVIMREAETLTLALADGQRPRIDRIVLRYDAAARKSSLLVLQGTPDTQPTAPGISRTALLYDLCLAQITRPAGSTTIVTGNITDTRLDPALCGVMRDGVTGIPTEELIASARERINALEETASAAAKEADASKTAAAQSEANAEAYKEAAATSESNAAGSASASADSAAAAARSESAAAGSATKAVGSASAAEQAKAAAATSEANAAKHEEAAKKAADEAGAKAGTDKTLSIENAPADAKATGDALAKKVGKDVILDEDGNVIFYSKAAVDELLAGKLSLSGGTLTGPLILPGGMTALGYANNAGNRNAMPPRDRSLGAPTTEHFEMIGSDKYNELFLGDYWTVEGVDWVIGDFKFWYNTGDTACTKPHVVVFPRNRLYTYKFNPTDTTAGGYVGSDLYKNGLTQARQMVTAAFGSAHILNHREYLVNAVTNGKPTGTDWYDSTVELMNENMVYGGRQFSPMPDGATNPWSTCRNYTINKSQLSLFRYEPWMICNGQWYWLQDVVSAVGFADVSSYGNGLADCTSASRNGGVRPVVGICQQ
jgi:hypothetical protein